MAPYQQLTYSDKTRNFFFFIMESFKYMKRYMRYDDREEREVNKVIVMLF